MNQKQVIDKVYEIVTPVLEDLEIWDIEMVKEGKNLYLRVYIDREEGGIGIDDCERISRYLSQTLDELDPITDPYMLEVSSPGITRALKRDSDFLRYIGHDIEIKLYKAHDKKKTLIGQLTAFENGVLTLTEDGKAIKFEKKDLASVRLAIHF